MSSSGSDMEMDGLHEKDVKIAIQERQIEEQQLLIADLKKQISDLQASFNALAVEVRANNQANYSSSVSGKEEKKSTKNTRTKRARLEKSSTTSGDSSESDTEKRSFATALATKKTATARKEDKPPANRLAQTSTKADNDAQTPKTQDVQPPTNGVATTIKERIPAVTLKGTSEWTAISKALATNQICYSRATTVRDGVRIVPATVEDHRRMTRYFEIIKRSYYTVQLEEDKKIYAVVRFLPIDAHIPTLLEDLTDQGITDAEVIQMKSHWTKKPMALFLVKTQNKEIFQVRTLYNLSVSVEPKRKPSTPGQCFRCQRYGHAQSRCTFPWRCVKCSGPHNSSDCELEKLEEERNATCALCGEKGHPASYKGCDEWKLVTKKKNRKQEPAKIAKVSTPVKKVETKTHVKEAPQKKKEEKKKEEKKQENSEDLASFAKNIIATMMKQFEEEMMKKMKISFGQVNGKHN